MSLKYWLTIHLKKNYGKRKNNNVLIGFFFFFISYKNGVKTFLKLIVNHCPTRQHGPLALLMLTLMVELMESSYNGFGRSFG